VSVFSTRDRRATGDSPKASTLRSCSGDVIADIVSMPRVGVGTFDLLARLKSGATGSPRRETRRKRGIGSDLVDARSHSGGNADKT
jgi:hypothetical protein